MKQAHDLLLVPFSPALAVAVEPSPRAVAWLTDHGFDLERPTLPKRGLWNIVHAMRADGLRPAYVTTKDALERLWNLTLTLEVK